MRHQERGVTLMELLTVIVVLGILASIAVPSYRNYLIRAQRTDAKTALLRVQAAQEKFYLSNNGYTQNVATAQPGGLGLSATSESGYYDIRIDFDEEDGNQSYTAVATPIAGKGQEDDDQCTSLSISDTGARAATGPGGRDLCWR
jgi:type IV pilus assembly protein PilE